MKHENTAPLFADCVASIDSRRLRRDGFFEAAARRARIVCAVISADQPEIEVELVWDAVASEITLAVPGRSDVAAVTVPVGRRPVERGGGYFFACPISGERCEKLYLARGAWGGRKAMGLTYSSQNGSLGDRYAHTARRLTAELEGAGGRPAPTSERRAWIEARLAKLERRLAGMTRRGPTRVYPEFGDHPDLAALVRAQEAQSPLRGPALATGRAIERAQALTDERDDTVQWLFRREAAFRALLDRPPAFDDARALAPDFLENYARISLRALAERGLLRHGSRRGVQLDWTGFDCGLDRCNLLLDLREDAAPFAGLEIFCGAQARDQAFRLQVCGDEVLFVCPLSGVLVDAIAFRGGVFASAEPLRMTRGAAARTGPALLTA